MATLVPLTPAGSRVKAYLEGGPELAKALQRLVDGTKVETIMEASLAGGEVIAEAWRERAPVGEAPEDKHPGAYRDAIKAMPARPRKGPAGINGATVVISTARVPGISKDDQPRVYAPRLEYGSLEQTKAQLKSGVHVRGRHRAAQPSARPAFDAAKERAVEAVEAKLRELVAKAVP